jgi:hypothetical protein
MARLTSLPARAGGLPEVRVFSGTDLHELHSFLAFNAGFSGGVSVAAGDIDGDGRADIITGAGPGGLPQVRIFSGTDLHELYSVVPYNTTFRGGVNVAAGDVDGDGRTDIVIGAGPGGGPQLMVLSGVDRHVIASFFAYDSTFHGGVSVAAGDVDGDGRSDLITGAGPGGGPHVKVFSGADQHLLASFFAYDPAFGGGVRVAAGDVDADGRIDVITIPGPSGVPQVRVFSGVDSMCWGTSRVCYRDGVSVASTGDTSTSWVGVRFDWPPSTNFRLEARHLHRRTRRADAALISAGALRAGVTFSTTATGPQPIGTRRRAPAARIH